MRSVVFVAGARPNFVKVAPLLRAIAPTGLRAELVHTGQHHDHAMAGVFFEELGIKPPDHELGIAGAQTEKIQQAFGAYLDGREAPRGVVVVGVGQTPPAGCESIIRYMLGQKLDFDPGTKSAYSNFGFCVLGRIIERVSGMRYEEFVKREILAPAGITRMKIGKSLASDDAAGEVHYYSETTARSVFPPLGKTVPWPYGGFNLEAMDSHGAWIASTIDLVKFANAIDGRRGKALLTRESIAELTSRPAPPMKQDTASWYGLGWEVRPVGSDANWWHAGSLPGTSTLLVRTHHGYAWAAVFNWRPEGRNRLPIDTDQGLWKAFGEVTAWPDLDLFTGH